jgi:enoyl-CoA hydratase/carnithine racemase
MLLSGRLVKAQEAKRLGLVNRVVPRAELLPEAVRLAERIKSLRPALSRGIKEAIVRGMDMALEEGLELETYLAARMLVSTVSSGG